MSITNLQLSVIMSAYCGNGMYSEGFPNTETFKKQVDILLQEEIIELNYILTNYKYKITDKGKSYLDAILSTPFPVEIKSWKIP